VLDLNKDISLKSYIEQKILDNQLNVKGTKFYNEMYAKTNRPDLKAKFKEKQHHELITNLIYYLSEDFVGHISVRKLMQAT
jgi:hypothetical protein